MTGRYGLVIMRAIRLAGAATVLALGAFIVVDAPTGERSCACPSRQPRAPGTSHELDDVDRYSAVSRTRLDDGAAASMRCISSSSAVTVFFSLLIAGLIVYFAVKYRRRSPDAIGAQHPRRPGARDHLDGRSRS